MTGADGMTAKGETVLSVPQGLDTVMGPVTASEGTQARIRWIEAFENVAELFPNLTEVIVERFMPWMLTKVPTTPLEGEKPVIIGAPAGCGSNARPSMFVGPAVSGLANKGLKE